MRGEFADYQFVYSPKRKTSPESFDYLFGYGKEQILFVHLSSDGIHETSLSRKQVTKIVAEKELLSAVLILHYTQDSTERTLKFPYVTSVYYLYDPFLNWLLEIPRDFVPSEAEQKNPRPEKLYHECLPMYNHSLDAYRLGDGFQEYDYRIQIGHHKWLP